MSEQTQSAHNATKKEKRPPLTHFLCFPLVNETSLPQLEASLAKFQAAIPLRPKTANDHPLKPRPPLFPDAAIRPVGTLHLTLGVMSLTTPERLEAAVELLHSLDLASMLREAEAQARRLPRKGRPLVTPTNPDGPDSEPPATSEVKEEEDIPLLQQPVLVAPAEPTPQKRPLEPLSVSLESLHALPKAKAATVLYASPVDATSRLYPFSVMLRDKFLEAGFLEGEYKKSKAKNHVRDEVCETEEGNKEGEGDSALRSEETAIHQSLLEEVPTGVAEDPPPSADRKRHRTKVKKPKPRPLLLHATVVNTIYVRGRHRENNNNDNNDNNNNNKKKRKNGPLTFDARGIISHYKDYYLDETRTQARPFPTDWSEETEQQITVPSEEEEETSTTSEEEEVEGGEEEDDTRRPPPKKLKTGGQQQKYPFIWAENLTLEKLCICEMGARTPDEDNALAVRLGQEYRIVAERSLLDLDKQEQQQQQQQQQQRDHHDVEVDVDIPGQEEEHADTDSTDSSDGGVRLSQSQL
ncbi:hypothetical protein VTN96DRAFT_10336 [Rasamsonia emersonii]|uniref:A-kinase anchor protein 7-like phosphoesterase domain-containing protein n=1 Tax=Rasamsonia emersonii (strain ATCC 16479 / CBS 393.64 / IMI 116815) TaxID=1408163 RepID=A0A0F4YMK4_RASE3|nr:hypothetical protein T310_6562 [Rasamsonia emersonii CBS 393.64]KKA19464.1 hypothetical protein T310_6562 [Rasamsonia emersonii CBS 393.64]